jgi:hypothetical protein
VLAGELAQTHRVPLNMLDILASPPLALFAPEDGEVIIDAVGRRAAR